MVETLEANVQYKSRLGELTVYEKYLEYNMR